MKNFLPGPAMHNSQALFGLAPTGAPTPEAGIRNLTESLGPIAHMRQVHEDRVAYAEESGLYEEYDALVTDIPNLWLAVKTADCVPVLVSSSNAVAAVHCGWRGLQQEILPLVIEILIQEFGAEPAEIHLAVGPHISRTNYAVGEELLEYFDPDHFRQTKEGDWQLDLFSVVTEQAIELDIPFANLWHAERCTFTDPALNSHRRSKQNGNPDDTARNLSLIALQE